MNHRRTERADGKICVEIRDVVCFLCPQRPRSRLGCQREALRQIISLTEGPWKRNECAHEAGMSDAPNTAMHHRQGPRGRRRLSRRHTNAVYPHHGITSFQTHYCGTYLNTSFSLFPLATVSISEIALGGKKKEKFTLEWRRVKSERLPEANQRKCVGKLAKLSTREPALRISINHFIPSVASLKTSHRKHSTDNTKDGKIQKMGSRV